MEYLLGDDARVRFTRQMLRDAALNVQVERIREATAIPAVRCTDRTPYPSGRLGLQYESRRTGWFVFPAWIVAHVEATSQDSPTGLLFERPDLVQDAGFADIDGRRVRGLRVRRTKLEVAAWLDPESQHLVESSFAITVGDKHIQIFRRWEYPRAGTIARPDGLKLPDCI